MPPIGRAPDCTGSLLRLWLRSGRWAPLGLLRRVLGHGGVWRWPLGPPCGSRFGRELQFLIEELVLHALQGPVDLRGGVAFCRAGGQADLRLEGTPASVKAGALVEGVHLMETELIRLGVDQLDVGVDVWQEEIPNRRREARMGDQIHKRCRAIEEPGHRRRPTRVFLEETGVDAQSRSNRLSLARFLDVEPERETGGVGSGNPVVAGPGKEPWVREPRNLDRTVRETVVEPKSLFPKPLFSRRRVHTVTDSAKVPEGRTTQWFRVVPRFGAKRNKIRWAAEGAP